MKIYHILILSLATFISCNSNEPSGKETQSKTTITKTDDGGTEYLTKDNRLVKIHYENDKMISQKIMDPVTKETLRYLLFHRDGVLRAG